MKGTKYIALLKLGIPRGGRGVLNYTIKDGKLLLEDGVQEVDFVINMDGNLKIGQGHSYLANGTDVQAAGQLKVNGQGFIRKIENLSGHYAPSVQQASAYPQLLNSSGLRTKNTWLELYEINLNQSGYADLSTLTKTSIKLK